MLAVRRKAVQSADRLSAAVRQQSHGSRRYASSAHGHDSHHAGPKDESLGTTFWVVAGLIPASVIIYTASRPGKDGNKPALERYIDSYSSWKEQWTARNTIHTNMIEQAAHDRILINSAKGSSTIDLKFPEVFNTGSPYNVVAGQGPRDMDALIAHYEKRNAEDDERKLKALADNSRS